VLAKVRGHSSVAARRLGADEGSSQRNGIGDGDLKVDSAPQGCLEQTGDPVPAGADLFQHQVGRAERNVGDTLLWSRVADLKTAHVAPKDEAAIDSDDQKFGDERRFEASIHKTIVAPPASRTPSVPLAVVSSGSLGQVASLEWSGRAPSADASFWKSTFQ